MTLCSHKKILIGGNRQQGFWISRITTLAYGPKPHTPTALTVTLDLQQ
jgi:hypothetical protein